MAFVVKSIASVNQDGGTANVDVRNKIRLSLCGMPTTPIGLFKM